MLHKCCILFAIFELLASLSCARAPVCVRACVCMYVCVRVSMCVYVRTCLRVHACVYMLACMCVLACTCMRAYIHQEWDRLAHLSRKRSLACRLAYVLRAVCVHICQRVVYWGCSWMPVVLRWWFRSSAVTFCAAHFRKSRRQNRQSESYFSSFFVKQNLQKKISPNKLFTGIIAWQYPWGMFRCFSRVYM